MIIKRNKMFSIIEKLFGVNDVDLVGQSETILREIIKVLVMGDKCPGDIDHWIDGVLRPAYEKLNGSSDDLKNSISSIFVVFMAKSEAERGRLGGQRSKFKHNKSSEEYFKYLWKEVYNQKENGILKYQKHMKPIPSKSDIENYLGQLWFVMCNFTGQANENTDPWTIYPGHPSIKFSKTAKFITPKEFAEKLKSIIFTLRPDIEFAYSEYKKR